MPYRSFLIPGWIAYYFQFLGLGNPLRSISEIQRPIRSIAVLPLANLSGDPSQDYFADGMTDELITMLAKNTSLRVVSRTSAMQYKNAKRPVGEIARELGVDGILEGSVEKIRGSHVHMTVQLIHASSDTHVWAESYDRTLSEAFLVAIGFVSDYRQRNKDGNLTGRAATPD